MGSALVLLSSLSNDSVARGGEFFIFLVPIIATFFFLFYFVFGAFPFA